MTIELENLAGNTKKFWYWRIILQLKELGGTLAPKVKSLQEIAIEVTMLSFLRIAPKWSSINPSHAISFNYLL
jgi:hypothetical protein